MPDANSTEPAIHIDPNEESFINFYHSFYRQLKDSLQYSFFKVTEYEAIETAQELQHYVDHASADDLRNLKDYEVNIDAVETNRMNTRPYAASRYLYDQKMINWDTMEKLGLNPQKLEQLNALEPLLKGYKTPMLLPIKIKLGNIESSMDVKLSLKPADSGMLEVRIHGMRKTPDFNSPFYDHQFTKEDQQNLLKTGNMGRVVDLTNQQTGEVFPVLISRDRLTNELVPYRTENIKIPDSIKGVRLDEQQKQTLKDGKVVFIENMLSRRGTLFSANIQFNAEKRYFEFLFNKNIKALHLKTHEQSQSQTQTQSEIPNTFRGKPLHKWQIEKLKVGEPTYIKDLTDKNGKPYQGYISFDREKGKFDFSFKNPKKQNESKEIKKISGKSKGRKM